MTKRGKKRKTSNHSQSSDHGVHDNYDYDWSNYGGGLGCDDSFTSSHIGAASNVLYGTPLQPAPIHNPSESESTYVKTVAGDSDEDVDEADADGDERNDGDDNLGGNSGDNLSLSSLDNKLNLVFSKLSGLDLLVTKVNNLEDRIKQVESRLTAVETNNNIMDNSVKFMSDQFDKINKESRNVDKRYDLADSAVINDLNNGMRKITEERDQLKGVVEDLQYRSMKMNLVFHGITGETRQEDSEELIRDFIYYELNIDEDIEFGNVHRFGKLHTGRPRPIVARFLYHRQRKMVLRNSYKLAGTRMGISEQFPSAIEERRRKLYPVMKSQRRAGKHVKLVRDALYINGVRYHEDDMDVHDTIPKQPAPQYGSSPRRYSDVVRERNHSHGGASYPSVARNTGQRQGGPSSAHNRHGANDIQEETTLKQIGTSRGQQFKPPPTGSFNGQGGDRVAHKDSGQGHLGEGLSQGRGQPR